MDHLAAEIGEFDRIEPSAQTRFHDGNSPLPRREIELKEAVHRTATTSARHKIHLRILGDTGKQGVPASPKPDGSTPLRDTDILPQHGSDERIPCECRSRIVRIGAMRHASTKPQPMEMRSRWLAKN